METNLSRFKKWLLVHEIFIRTLIQINETNPRTQMRSPVLAQLVTDPIFYKEYVDIHDFTDLGSQGLGATLDICFDNFRITENTKTWDQLTEKFPVYATRWNELADFMAITPGSN